MCLCCKCGSDGMDGGESESEICLMSVFVLCCVNWPSHTRLYVALPITFSSLVCIGLVLLVNYTISSCSKGGGGQVCGLAVSMLHCDSHVGNVNLSLAPSLPVLDIKPAVSLFVF